MDDKELEQAARELTEIVNCHPPMPHEDLRALLVDAARQHGPKDADYDPGSIEVQTCLLISVLSELVRYRDKYGLLDLPSEKYGLRIERRSADDEEDD